MTEAENPPVRGRKTVRAVIAALLILAAAFAAWRLISGLSGLYENVTHPLLYEEYIEKYSQEYGVPKEIICAVINTESSFIPDAVSGAGATGLMQITEETFWWLMSKTGEELETEKLKDPETSIKYGTLFLSLLSDEFGSWNTVFAAYNAGRTRVAGWLDDDTVSNGGELVNIPIKETADYVVKVGKNIEVYREMLEAE